MIRFLVVVLAVALVLVVGGFLLPAQLSLERSVVVNRPAATVFTLLDGFRTWPAWSPWSELDPNAELSVSGPDTGVGARLSWSGDPALVGSGAQEIVVSEPFERVVLATSLGGQGQATVTYRVEGGGLGSRVSWHFETDLIAGQGALGGLVGRYYGLFLERWVREDFDRGLRRFKGFAERLPEWDFADAPITRSTATAFPVAIVAGIEDEGAGAVATGLAVAFAELATWATASGIPIEGAPLAITRRGDDGRDRFEAALPLPSGITVLGMPSADVDATSPVAPGPETDRAAAGAAEPLAGAVEDESAEQGEGHGMPAVEGLDPPASPAPRAIPSGRITLGEAPAGEAACIIHRGEADDTLGSYEQLFAWLAAHGYRETGVSWERYWLDPAGTDGASGHTDICFLIDRDG